MDDWLPRSEGEVPWWGVTGPPGAGKSTLVDALISALRARGRRVGVVAIDPTSPVSNGALLGDRIRMMRHAVDADVFIRSLATRGCEGGLSDAAADCARLLELANFDPVLIETVGVGQGEADIAEIADICMVVLGPGYGDSIQLIKAGLLEIADVLVVNKCDLPEATRLLSEVQTEIGATPAGEDVEVIGVEAKSGKGVDGLLEKLLELDHIGRGEEERYRRQCRRVLGEIRRSATLACRRVLERELSGPEADELADKLVRGDLSFGAVLAQLGRAFAAEQQKQDDDVA